MGLGFKEVACLRGNDKLYEENLNKIDWSGVGGRVEETLHGNESDKDQYLCMGCDKPHKADSVCSLCGHTNSTVEFKKLPTTSSELPDHTIERDYEWVKWDGTYEKRLYFVKTKEGLIYECFPNAGFMNEINTNLNFTVEDEIEVAIWD